MRVCYEFKWNKSLLEIKTTGGPVDLLVDTGQRLNAPKAQVQGHVTRRQPEKMKHLP